MFSGIRVLALDMAGERAQGLPEDGQTRAKINKNPRNFTKCLIRIVQADLFWIGYDFVRLPEWYRMT